VLAVVVALAGAAGPAAPASAQSDCAGAPTVFAVDATNGHLAELALCPEAVTRGTEVDAGDWRVYRQIVAVRDFEAVVLYAVTADGQLLWRRQDAAGAPLSPPVRVGASVDWSQFASIFAAAGGYLGAVEAGGTPSRAVRMYRHDGWTVGDAAMSEAAPILAPFVGPPLTGLVWGLRAESNIGGLHFRVWRRTGAPWADVWYLNGRLPAGLYNAVGIEPSLYAVDSGGEVVLMRQPPLPPKLPVCNLTPQLDWRIVARSTGGYGSVIAPARGGGWDATPVPLAPPPASCPADIGPYEWQ